MIAVVPVSYVEGQEKCRGWEAVKEREKCERRVSSGGEREREGGKERVWMLESERSGWQLVKDGKDWRDVMTACVGDEDCGRLAGT